MDFDADFKEKANAFANWCTSIIVANFVYLAGFNDKIFITRLGDKEWLWHIGFGSTIAGLIFIFLFKFVGVATAYFRTLKEGQACRGLEVARVVFFLFFIVSLLIAVISSLVIIYGHFYLRKS